MPLFARCEYPVSLVLTRSPKDLRREFLALKSPRELAKLLEVKYSQLIYHLYKVPAEEKYVTFEVPKKSGGHRRISAPAKSLKIIQRKLGQVLASVYEGKASVHGFVQGRSIVTNAQTHRRQKYVFNLDLLNFFPSINFGRVRGLFIAIPYNLPSSVATVLAQICCHDNQLPQGAPTSPIVSNLICSSLDTQLLRLAQRNRSLYTRYADDITFSTSMPSFPRQLAREDRSGLVVPGKELGAIIRHNGFGVNLNKVRLRTRYRRQEVTGLTVNKFPNLPRKFVRQIRAMLHAWDKYGLEAAQEHFRLRYSGKYRHPNLPPSQFEQVLRGKIEFLGMVRGNDDPLYLRFREQLSSLAPSGVSSPESEEQNLLEAYQNLQESDDPQRRGYLLQGLMGRMFQLSGLEMAKPFVRSEGSEQIDGAFEHKGWYYLVECRWRKKLANIRELDGLSGQVRRTAKQTMGFFISVNGWSENVVPLLLQESDKSIVLMDGEDILAVLEERVSLLELIEAKLRSLNLDNLPFLSASDFISDKDGAAT